MWRDWQAARNDPLIKKRDVTGRLPQMTLWPFGSAIYWVLSLLKFTKCSMYNIYSSSWWLDWLHLQGANHILHSFMISFTANLHHTFVPTIFFLISMKSWGADILRQNSFLSKIEILKFAQLPLRQANFCVSCSSSFKFLTTFSHRPQLPSVELFFPDKDVFSTKKISMWMKKAVVDILLLLQHLTKYVFLWHNIVWSDWPK